MNVIEIKHVVLREFDLYYEYMSEYKKVCHFFCE